ncbi:MAG: 2',3'-cyclic-nucleotide 2'-phosphodiesterase (5'-nucleotidase family) [Chitinophagales bacterium]
MRALLLFSMISAGLVACNRSFTIYDFEDTQQKFTDSYTGQDMGIEEEILPYRTELEASMNKLIVLAHGDLPKAQPSSPLGNLLADATREMASTYISEDINIGIMNYGGIRVPSISKGNVSIGNVYEVMPFDNYLVVMRLKGSKLKEVFDAIAGGGGWPVSGVSFTIKNGKASQVMINGAALELEKEYSVAISDYLANGGDHLNMLKGLEQTNTNVLLRDAFMDYFRRVHEYGDELQVNDEIRISNE